MKNPSVLIIGWLLVHISAGEALGETAKLSLSLRTDKSSIVLGEPLFITARVSNENAEPVSVYQQNSPTYERQGTTPFLIMISEDGTNFASWLDGFRVLGKTSPIELAPGADLTSNLVVLFSHDRGFAFKQPRGFWISVKVQDTDGSSFQAEPIQLTVMRPVGSSLEAWGVLRRKKFKDKYGELIQSPWGADLRVADVEQCDGIITAYPRSIHAEYLALYLGRWYRESPDKDKTKSARYLEIAKSSASSESLKTKVIEAIARD